jgi:hypothetical protein
MLGGRLGEQARKQTRRIGLETDRGRRMQTGEEARKQTGGAC